ncbi:hypothetical protein NC651_016301 [Populus alba x Populus x berolinensis]|nr:hypothetical protein NC651_016301 [Populus alba x Populus x berolinensis]
MKNLFNFPIPKASLKTSKVENALLQPRLEQWRFLCSGSQRYWLQQTYIFFASALPVIAFGEQLSKENRMVSDSHCGLWSSFNGIKVWQALSFGVPGKLPSGVFFLGDCESPLPLGHCILGALDAVIKPSAANELKDLKDTAMKDDDGGIAYGTL